MTDQPLRLRYRTTAPLATVRAALTDAAALQDWLAEHADIDIAQGTYAFWGRYTPDGAEPHQRLLGVDDQGIRFEWRLHDVTTTVEFGLTETDGETVIALTQTGVPNWADVVAGTAGPLGVLGTFWSLALANLIDHAEGRPTTPKCDFTATAELRAQLTVGDAPDEVYQSLMDPGRFGRWFGAKMSVEPHVGGRWAMGEDFEDENSLARIIELEPGHRVALDWGGMVSTWELEESEGKTRLTFVNSGFDEKKPPFADWTGWLSGLAGLRRFHELPDFRPTWLSVQWPGMDDGILVKEST